MARASTQVQHFGVTVRPGPIHGLTIDRATYTNVSRTNGWPFMHLSAIERGYLSDEEAARMFVDPSTCREYKEEYAHEKVERALRNFDLNMMFFRRLDPDRFKQEVDGVLAAFPSLEPVTDLRTWAERPGIYMLVLDDYCQVYVGKAAQIGRRIRQHWSSSKPLDRLIFGAEDHSLLSIDSFRALDTTRIYAQAKGLGSVTRRDTFERQVVAHIAPDLSLNRIAGGEGFAALAEDVLQGRKQRDLTASNEEWAEYYARLDATETGREVHPRGSRRSSTNAAKTQPKEPDLVSQLCQEANRRKRHFALVIDAAGSIYQVREDGINQPLPEHDTQLFLIPCGHSISKRSMQDALDFMASLDEPILKGPPYEVIF